MKIIIYFFANIFSYHVSMLIKIIARRKSSVLASSCGNDVIIDKIRNFVESLKGVD